MRRSRSGREQADQTLARYEAAIATVEDAGEELRQRRHRQLAVGQLRHESVATTQAYLHPTREDLAAALASMGEVVRSGEVDSA